MRGGRGPDGRRGVERLARGDSGPRLGLRVPGPAAYHRLRRHPRQAQRPRGQREPTHGEQHPPGPRLTVPSPPGPSPARTSRLVLHTGPTDRHGMGHRAVGCRTAGRRAVGPHRVRGRATGRCTADRWISRRRAARRSAAGCRGPRRGEAARQPGDQRVGGRRTPRPAGRRVADPADTPRSPGVPAPTAVRAPGAPPGAERAAADPTDAAAAPPKNPAAPRNEPTALPEDPVAPVEDPAGRPEEPAAPPEGPVPGETCERHAVGSAYGVHGVSGGSFVTSVVVPFVMVIPPRCACVPRSAGRCAGYASFGGVGRELGGMSLERGAAVEGRGGYGFRGAGAAAMIGGVGS